MGIKPLYYYPTPRRRAVRLRAEGDPGQPAGRAGGRHSTGCASCSPSPRRPGTAVCDGHARGAARAPCVTVDRGGLREPRYWALEAARAHRRPGRPPSARCASCWRTSSTASWSPTCRVCTLLSGGLDSSGDHRAGGTSSWRARRDGAHVSRWTSSGRPRTSGPTSCAPPRTRRTSHDWRGTSAPSTGHRARHRPSSPTRRSAARCCAPATCPVGLGDMDTSLYLLFRAIREHSTVALSGESADEVFGGYRVVPRPGGRSRPTPSRGSRAFDDRRRGAGALLRPGRWPPRWTWPATSPTGTPSALAEVDRARRGERPASGGCGRSATCT